MIVKILMLTFFVQILLFQISQKNGEVGGPIEEKF